MEYKPKVRSSLAKQHPTGLLLVGHGTRNRQGTDEFLQTVELVRQCLPTVLVEPCFLEKSQPTIKEAVQCLAGQGISSLVVSPLLLFAAGHVLHDIPLAVREAVDGQANLSIKFSGPLGCQEKLLQLSVLRYQQALCGEEELAPEGTALVMVGRGSREPTATDEMRRFVDLRCQLAQVGHATTCFLAMAEPTLPQALAAAAATNCRRIVVQPHLLFVGDLLGRLSEEVDAARRHWPQRQWILAEHLGVDRLLAEAVIGRYEKTRRTPSN